MKVHNIVLEVQPQHSTSLKQAEPKKSLQVVHD